jgi:hypothetical protein
VTSRGFFNTLLAAAIVALAAAASKPLLNAVDQAKEAVAINNQRIATLDEVLVASSE